LHHGGRPGGVGFLGGSTHSIIFGSGGKMRLRVNPPFTLLQFRCTLPGVDAPMCAGANVLVLTTAAVTPHWALPVRARAGCATLPVRAPGAVWRANCTTLRCALVPAPWSLELKK
jgi:hypothetical protein